MGTCSAVSVQSSLFLTAVCTDCHNNITIETPIRYTVIPLLKDTLAKGHLTDEDRNYLAASTLIAFNPPSQ